MSEKMILRRLSDGQAIEVNKSLSDHPADADEAKSYGEIYTLWTELDSARGTGRMSPERFTTWDSAVKSLLRTAEIERFEKPLRPGLENSEGNIQHARYFHLTKILWARQGIEATMSDTGF